MPVITPVASFGNKSMDMVKARVDVELYSQSVKAKMGRPSSYTPEMAALICERLSGGEALKAMCADADMPSMRTVLGWLFRDEDAEFVPMYARAREAQAEIMADEIISIADDAGHDWVIDKDGNKTLNTEAVQRSRLRVDARKWVAAKLLPRKYGDHSSKTLTIQPGEGFTKLLESLDDKPMVTIEATVIDGD